MRVVVASLPVVVVVVGCRPAFDDRVSLVDGVRVLAVAADPPEAAPGEAVTLSALVVDDDGVVAAPRVAWGLCRAPRAATDTGTLPTSCVEGDVDALAIDGVTGAAVVPEDACAVFGSWRRAEARRPSRAVAGLMRAWMTAMVAEG